MASYTSPAEGWSNAKSCRHKTDGGHGGGGGEGGGGGGKGGKGGGGGGKGGSGGVGGWGGDGGFGDGGAAGGEGRPATAAANAVPICRPTNGSVAKRPTPQAAARVLPAHMATHALDRLG